MLTQQYDKKTYQEKCKQELDAMKQTITHVMENYRDNPEDLAELAQFSARFYGYSVRNQILIQKQNRGASFTGSFEKFKQMGYSVKRGERGIKIFVPTPLSFFRTSPDEDWIPISEADEQERQDIKKGLCETKKIMAFKKGTVFDISQTDCPIEDYPKLFHMGYSSRQHAQIYRALKSYCEQELHCPVSEEDIKSISLCGFYSPDAHAITLNYRLEDTQKLSVLTHEMGHALLRHGSQDKRSEAQQELEADIISMMLQTHFGVEIPDVRKSHLAAHYRTYQDEIGQEEEAQQISSVLERFQKANDVYKAHIEDMDQTVEKFLELGEVSMNIRPLTKEEQLYTQKQSTQIEGQTGYRGCLKGDFGKTGNEFFTDWGKAYYGKNQEEFATELDSVVHQLQSAEIGLLEGRNAMTTYLQNHPDSILPNGEGYGFRVDTKNNAYLILCTPDAEESDFSCYCYESQWLDGHIEKAKEGIRFITSDYQERFRIPDGASIIITDVTGGQRECVCRYIDEAHLEVGNNLFHSCHFAEILEQNGSVCEPKPQEQQTQTIDQSKMDQAFESYYQKQNGISYSETSTKENPQSDFEK